MIGDPGPHQGFLEAAGEEVVAIENRHPRPARAFALAGQQRFGEACGFCVAFTIAHELDASPLPFPGEERFAEARFVLRDDRIGGREDTPKDLVNCRRNNFATLTESKQSSGPCRTGLGARAG